MQAEGNGLTRRVRQTAPQHRASVNSHVFVIPKMRKHRDQLPGDADVDEKLKRMRYIADDEIAPPGA